MARRRIRRKAKPSWLRRIKQGLYTGVIGLGLVIGASYLPAALADEYPVVQRTLEVAVEARQWAFQAMVDTGTLAGGELRVLLEWLPAKVREGLPIVGGGRYTPIPAGSLPRTAASWPLARSAVLRVCLQRP